MKEDVKCDSCYHVSPINKDLELLKKLGQDETLEKVRNIREQFKLEKSSPQVVVIEPPIKKEKTLILESPLKKQATIKLERPSSEFLKRKRTEVLKRSQSENPNRVKTEIVEIDLSLRKKRRKLSEIIDLSDDFDEKQTDER